MDAANIASGLAARIVGVPVIVCGGRSMSPEHFALYQPYMRPGYRALIDDPSVVFLNNSQAGAVDYARWLALPRDRIQVLHNGIEFPELPDAAARADARSSLGLPASGPIVGSILRFAAEKQPRLMIDAMAQILRQRDDTCTIVFGSGAQHEAMRRYVASLGLDRRLLLPGYTDNPWRSLSCMDLFLLTSRAEGLPNVLIEAQAMGVPVVSTAVGGARETFVDGTTGWAVTEHTPEVIGRICLELLSDSAKRAAAAIAACRFARERFGSARMIADTITVYRAAMARADAAA
jgi:glycosyltransferase involved in cell wall biosynthesis